MSEEKKEEVEKISPADGMQRIALILEVLNSIPHAVDQSTCLTLVCSMWLKEAIKKECFEKGVDNFCKIIKDAAMKERLKNEAAINSLANKE